MARTLIRLPSRLLTCLLRLISAGVTFVFVFFTHVTGQSPKTSSSDGAGLHKSAATASLIDMPSPLYGIIPDYGVPEYGMPYATYRVKGVLKSAASGQSIRGIQMTIADTTTKQERVDTTRTDGRFDFIFSSEEPRTITWTLKAEDIDGPARGAFDSKDTLITIDLDSLKGGSGFFRGSAEVDIELFLTEKSVRALDHSTHPAVHTGWMQAGNLLQVRTDLPAAGHAALRIYDASGRLARSVFEEHKSAGFHISAIPTTGLRPGFYFAKLSAAGYVTVHKFTVR